jgi:hypothetical protein
MVRKNFLSKREKVIGGWGKVHSNELHDLYLSLNTIPLKKSRRIGWAGYVKRMGEKKMHNGFW